MSRRLVPQLAALSILVLFSADLAAEDFASFALRIRYERRDGPDLVTGHGTAFGTDLSTYGLAGRRYLLSAAHNVLQDSGQPYAIIKIEVRESSRAFWIPARVIASDTQIDLCVLECDRDLPAVAKLAQAEPETGGAVVLAGSKRGGPVAVYRGVLDRKFFHGSARTKVRIPFDHGDSGGPFFHAQTGEVVGVAVAGVPHAGDLDPQIGLYAPIAAVRGFLETHAGRRNVRTPVFDLPREERTLSVAEPNSPPVLSNALPAPREKLTSGEAVNRVAGDLFASLPKETIVLDLGSEVETAELKPVQPSAKSILTNLAEKSTTPASASAEGFAFPREEAEAPKTTRAYLRTYVVRNGDSFWTIARKFGVEYERLLAVNRTQDPDKLFPGQTVVLP